MGRRLHSAALPTIAKLPKLSQFNVGQTGIQPGKSGARELSRANSSSDGFDELSADLKFTGTSSGSMRPD